MLKTEFNNIMLFAGPTKSENLPMGFISSIAMIPLRGKPIIWWQLDNLKKNGIDKVILILNDDDFRLIKYTREILEKSFDIKTILVKKEKSIINSLRHGLKVSNLHLPTRVILGDTFLTEKFTDETDLLITSKAVNFSDYWCFIDKDSNDYIKTFYDKKINIDIKNKEALVGYYCFSDSKTLFKCTLESEFLKKRELSDTLKRYKKKYHLKTKLTQHWFDLGHTSGLIKAKNILFNLRSFNNIEVDNELGILSKKSSNVQKLEDEAYWYNELPQELQILAPRFISFSKTKTEATLKQELYGYSSLSELYLSCEVNLEDWKIIIEKLFNLHKVFEKYTKPNNEELISWLYMNKTFERLDSLKSQNDLWEHLINKEKIVINEEKYDNIPLLKEKIENFAIKLSKNANFTITHGDYCFSNILFDSSNYQFKLIDPRGRLHNRQTIYGDPRYDIAKLRHSICGLYDFVVNGLFCIEKKHDNFCYQILTMIDYSKLEKVFDDLCIKNGFDIEEIKFIEALLFLSMIPLHKDSLNRQKLFYCKSIQLLNEVL